VSVPLHCPRCSCDHLHADAYISAEDGDRFEVIESACDDISSNEARVRVRINERGRVERPDEVLLSCCACDWHNDAFIDWDSTSA
jgi:hypothetical protein